MAQIPIRLTVVEAVGISFFRRHALNLLSDYSRSIDPNGPFFLLCSFPGTLLYVTERFADLHIAIFRRSGDECRRALLAAHLADDRFK